MSADSIVGEVGNNLSDESKAILAEVVAQITGTAAYVNVGGATAVYGTQSTGVITGVLPASNSAVVGDLKDTNFTVGVELPANIGINFTGPANNVSVELAADYFSGLILAAMPKNNPDPVVQSKAQSLQAAVSVVKNAAVNGDTSVRYVELTNVQPSGAGGNVKIVGSGAANEVVAINTAQLVGNQQLILQDLDKVILVNKADVVVTGTKAAVVVGDNADQKITGGQGADTLVGGGGSDTLVGGSGSDTFGFVSGGNVQIGDFNFREDKFAFSLEGVNNFQDLVKLVTQVQETSTGVTYTFGGAGVGTITLMGVRDSDINADLIKFTIGNA
jgi:Ca2+-binding RTX toxin-like protein